MPVPVQRFMLRFRATVSHNLRFFVRLMAIIVVGMQWGDEGKGKIVDLLAAEADWIVRSQGGNNAGHTIKVGDEEYRFHLIPSGVLYPGVRAAVCGGTAIDPEVLIDEIRRLEVQGVEVKGRLALSQYAHMVMPYHRLIDRLSEAQKGTHAIGTTGRGIGPCYADRINRVGIRLGEFVRKDIFKNKLKRVVEQKNRELAGLFQHAPLKWEEIFEANLSYAEQLAPYVTDVENQLSIALKEGKRVLFEGAHGTYLDITYGTYPYVTSSSTLSAGIATGAGIGPTRIGVTVGVVKAYTTRVGNGPLPTTMTPEEEKLFLDHHAAREIGTTTGRKRRLAWFDGPLARYAVRLNGVDTLAVTKLDVLDSLSKIKVCTGYLLDGKKLDIPPAIVEDLERVQPIYEELPGWQTATSNVKSIGDLPKNARHYLDKIAALCEAPISLVSVGPEREKTLMLQNIYELSHC